LISLVVYLPLLSQKKQKEQPKEQTEQQKCELPDNTKNRSNNAWIDVLASTHHEASKADSMNKYFDHTTSFLTDDIDFEEQEEDNTDETDVAILFEKQRQQRATQSSTLSRNQQEDNLNRFIALSSFNNQTHKVPTQPHPPADDIQIQPNNPQENNQGKRKRKFLD